MFEGSQITIEVPFGYDQRDRLLEFLKSKLAGAEILIVHSEVSAPIVGEVLVRHDKASEAEITAAGTPGEDSESVLLKASDLLSAFTKSGR